MRGDTIIALCTAQGKGALSVLRISGPKALKTIKPIAPFLPSNLQSHKNYFGTLKDKGKDLDQVLIAYFKQGQSFTGEETIEISCHGGEIYSDILKTLLEKGLRLAEKGEFSLQAFSNGKLDLVQAEALLQLIESESEGARSQALSQLKGELSQKLLELEKKWLFVLSHIEADIDFALEELTLLSEQELQEKLKELSQNLEELMSKYQPFEKLQKGLIFGLFGASNVGKSSLFNALLNEERAIVSNEEGTTRDVVSSGIKNPKGLNVVLKDTAGFRESSSDGELKGQQRAKKLFEDCDYRLILLDSSQTKPLSSLPHLKNTWLVFTKIDRIDTTKPSFKKALLKKLENQKNPLKPEKTFYVSSLSGKGILPLKEALLACGAFRSEELLISNSRHFKALKTMKQALQKGMELNREKEIVALELREGLLALYEILGKKIEDQVLDQIFKQFCIGK